MKSLLALCLFFSPAALAGGTAPHNHLTIDTTGGAGGQVVIRAGFNPSETQFTIDETGRLLNDGEPAAYECPDVIADSGQGVDAWAAADELVLTSDFYFATGRLDGGDFYFEFVSVTPVAPGHVGADYAWGVAEAKSLEIDARTSGATRADRSFHVGAGSHVHGQFMAVSRHATCDVTIVAWDANAVYADSAPVTFRVIGAGAGADLNDDTSVNSTDLALLLGAWGACGNLSTPCPADLNNDGIVNSSDLALLLGSWR